ncbi:MAG: hypothetical protein F6K09_31020 [Merismopedia sp. SIO2A8]|nr:hypothetical protein [Merismopedia sp. SIO2A8]
MIQDEELRNLYKISGEESVHKLRIGLLYLQQHPQDETTLEELLNEIHSLKGDSRIVGVEKVETIAHKFHEILGSIPRARHGAPFCCSAWRKREPLWPVPGGFGGHRRGRSRSVDVW